MWQCGRTTPQLSLDGAESIQADAVVAWAHEEIHGHKAMRIG